MTVPRRLENQALALMPPGASLEEPGAAAASVALAERDGRFVVTAEGEPVVTAEGEPVVTAEGEPVSETTDEDHALDLLDARIRAQVALLAPEHIFVHAGAVALAGRAIVLPGFTFTGKTTLTRALVESGATYYSDEFAVIDAAGMVHPYPKPLSIRHRDGSGRTTETPAASLGAGTGRCPVPVGLIAVTRYAPGATLAPEPLVAGAALLALLGHTIPARTRPQQSMAALKAAVQEARAWRSDRGEAEATARAIIAEARADAAQRGATSSA